MLETGRHPLRSALLAMLDPPSADSDLVADLARERLVAMSRLVQYRIATAPQPIADRCRMALDALTETAAHLLLRSPELCVIGRLGEDAEALAVLLESANADAPRPALDCGLAIDQTLPPMTGHPSSGLRRPRPLSSDETKVAVARCDRAIDLLHTIDPTGWSILSALADSVVLRIDDGRLGECWGATSGLAIGRIVLVNVADARSDAHFAEALLHEAVHVALDCAELRRPLLVPDADPDGPRLASPWTGTPLTAHAYLHAIIVWAVLLAFWHRLLKEGDGRADMIERRDWIRDGFDRLDLDSLALIRRALAPHAAAVAKAAVDAVAINRPAPKLAG